MALKQYILFDHDGVLVDSEPYYFKANAQALAELGITFTHERCLQLMADGISCWTLAEQQNIPKIKIDQARVRRNSYYQDSLSTQDLEIPGVLETLKELSASFQMGIVTTAKKEDFDLIHQHRSILDWMAFALTPQDYTGKKPLPYPYLAGLARFGIDAEQAIVVEDSARGLKSALAAGIDCIVVDNAFTRGQDFTGAIKKIDSIRELPKVLSELNATLASEQ